MIKEDTCSRFITSTLVSVLVLYTSVGFAFAPEVSDFYPPDNEFLANIKEASPDFQLDSSQAAFIVIASNELQGKICQASIQNQIAWNYKGNRTWARRNLEAICKNAEFSLQPGTCFHRIMHGEIDRGGGTRWKWQAALKLCAGTMNSTATINCFSEAISRQVTWPQAIEQCRDN